MTATTDVVAAASGLVLTPHPLQRTGVWAVAGLARRTHPGEVDAADLARVVELLVADVAAAAVAGKEDGAYSWWKVLFALYPNAKPTHASRSRERAAMVEEVRRFFAPDDAGGPDVRPCVFCGAPSSVVWSKSMLPMFDTTKFLNTLPPNSRGWAVCRACRIALWAMPYGASVTAGSATVMTCDDASVERLFVRRNVRRNQRIIDAGFEGVRADSSPEAVTLWALRRHADVDAAATLWVFKNDNQEPWLRVTGTRLAAVRFLRAVRADPAARRGWARLRARLARRAADGTVTLRGSDAAARLLFAAADDGRDRFTDSLFRLGQSVEDLRGSTLMAWRDLFRLYLKEMHRMDPSGVKPAAELLVDWITQEPNPRGRFNDYRRVAGKAYPLQRLLMEATGRLLLDGQSPPDITRTAPALLASTPAGWQLRGQLFFEVAAELVQRKAAIGSRDEAEDDGDDADVVGIDPIETDEDEESA